MKRLFNPLLTDKPEKRLKKCYRLKEIKKEAKKSYLKWRKEINNNNDLFENLYFAACQEEARLIEFYDSNVGGKIVIAENNDGEIIGGNSFNQIYDTLEGDYYHYRDKEALILVNTCDKSKRWHFYKKPEGRAERMDIFAHIEINSEPVENDINKKNESNKDNESEEYEDATEENSDC